MIEPTKKFKALRTKAEIDSINSFGHNIKTIFEYYSALKSCGFKIQRYYLFSVDPYLYFVSSLLVSVYIICLLFLILGFIKKKYINLY